eukprot:934158_1
MSRQFACQTNDEAITTNDEHAVNTTTNTCTMWRYLYGGQPPTHNNPPPHVVQNSNVQPPPPTGYCCTAPQRMTHLNISPPQQHGQPQPHSPPPDTRHHTFSTARHQTSYI